MNKKAAAARAKLALERETLVALTMDVMTGVGGGFGASGGGSGSFGGGAATGTGGGITVAGTLLSRQGCAI